MVSEYKTTDNSTILIVVVPEDEEIFTTSDEYEIEEVIVTNSREIINVIIPTQFELKNAYPNPFNSITNIEFSIPMDSYVTVKIYNLLGKEISTLVDDPLQTGFHNVNWDADQFASGVYFIKLNTGDYTQSQKLMLIK